MKQIRCFCVFAAGAFFASACAAQSDHFLDGILMVVNSSVITVLQVQDQIALELNRLQSVYGADQTNLSFKAGQLEQDELEALKRSKLILDDFAKGQYTTNWVDDAVDEAIKKEIKKTYGGSQTKFILTLQAVGMTKEDYRKQQRENVIVSQLAYLHSTGKIIISPAAIEKYYNDRKDEFHVEDQVKLRTICITQSPGNPPGASRQLAAEILRKIDGGVPFAEMAKEFSADEHRAAGGSWGGWVPCNDLVAPLRDAALSLKPGERGPVVELPDEKTGAAICYLLMVEDFRPAHISPLSEVQGAIERTLQAQRGKLLQDQWIERLKAKSHIETF
jgi:parvulin-like peptidyl-prolyl isomerase